MIRLCLTGYPLEHSLSPLLHEAAQQASRLQGTYSLCPVRSGDMDRLRELVSQIRGRELTGLNVTIPHKQVVMQFLDELTPTAGAIGAVNTVYLRDGNVVGDNTDSPGFTMDLIRFLPDPRAALVLGAGGAARAVAYSLWSEGCIVSVAARRSEQAGELAARLPGVSAMELNARTLQQAAPELIVNATPAGMFPDVEKCAWPEGLPFPSGVAVYDLIYSPSETRLIKWARAEGLRATGGLGMLVEQAALAFELWTGYKIGREVLLDAVGRSTQ